MKKVLVALLIALMTMPCAMAYNNAVIREQTQYVEDAANTTVTLLPATTGLVYTVYGFDLAVSTADTIYLECGSTKLSGYFLGATSGVVRTYYPMFLQCPAGIAVNLVKGTATTPVKITLFYSADNP